MQQPAKEKEMRSYLDAFAAVESRQTAAPDWWRQLRREAMAAFEQIGFPTTRHEEWKYTNVAPIVRTPFIHTPTSAGTIPVAPPIYPESQRSQLVFVNGIFTPSLSNLSGLPAGVIVTTFAQADQNLLRDALATQADFRNEAFTALNTALAEDGALVIIPRGKVVSAPIHLLFMTAGGVDKIITHPRVLLVAEAGSLATVIESYFGVGETDVYFTNAVTEFLLREEAQLTHYRLQEESLKAFQIATTRVYQERASRYASYAIMLGGELARHTLSLKLDGEHTESIVDGLYIGTGRQHLDNHTTIDHARPHCSSQQLYKGILDEEARAVFNGKIFVRPGALLTDARQLNKNLLLSKEAHVDTKPQLEIFADDVKCAHGATVGQLEEDEIFYLQSRGLTLERARALLTYGFAEDVISKIRLGSVHRQLDHLVLARLHQNLEVH